MKHGFDNDKYLQMQSAHIRERIAAFGGKLYLEFGGNSGLWNPKTISGKIQRNQL